VGARVIRIWGLELLRDGERGRWLREYLSSVDAAETPIPFLLERRGSDTLWYRLPAAVGYEVVFRYHVDMALWRGPSKPSLLEKRS
jgi:hypothetical protein